jgi:hypothetical protein
VCQHPGNYNLLFFNRFFRTRDIQVGAIVNRSGKRSIKMKVDADAKDKIGRCLHCWLRNQNWGIGTRILNKNYRKYCSAVTGYAWSYFSLISSK